MLQNKLHLNFFLESFQLIASAPNNNSLLTDQDTNRFLV